MKAKTKEPGDRGRRRSPRKPRLVAASPCQEKEKGEVCGGPIIARGFCWVHLKRFYRHGNTKTVLKPGVKV